MYFVFDLDGTLANLYSEFYFVMSLQNSTNYVKFINKIAEIEASPNPLGILRPGILYVMEKLHKLKSNVMIYSNNGNIESLEFVKDVIHAHLKGNLIKKCIHLDHSLRSIVPKNSMYDKTWEELKHILETFNTNVEPNEVYFFDDREHKNLFNVNYILVPEYTFVASFNRIAEIYKTITNDVKTIEICRSKTRVCNKDVSPPCPDVGIYLMIRTIDGTAVTAATAAVTAATATAKAKATKANARAKARAKARARAKKRKTKKKEKF